ncbi:hypothetical protein BDV95DRAFT_550982 [Massariosphaeria phaeospora]|uniref:BTB domain-containing protein n=1 Tax=Massariosphaeria phaeospora TaxID=100035 RepID=A0A7C8M3Q2_9PLEO|nr:hypothetical protein BDV95DRAFT_550982 [Massariosphaeria phaeospora]
MVESITPGSHLLVNIKKLYATSSYSDLNITCGDDTHQVHKAIVCSGSEFLARAVKFRVGKEHEDGKIDLPDDDPQTISILIKFLYEGDYDPTLSETGRIATKELPTNTHYTYAFPHTCRNNCPRPHHLVCPHHKCGTTCDDSCQDFTCAECTAIVYVPGDQLEPHHLLLHAKMYEMGDKYQVHGLQEIAQEKFKRQCSFHWDDNQFAVAAHYAYSTTLDTNTGLREIVRDTICKHPKLLDKSAVDTLLDEFGGLAAGILRVKAKDLG